MPQELEGAWTLLLRRCAVFCARYARRLRKGPAAPEALDLGALAGHVIDQLGVLAEGPKREIPTAIQRARPPRLSSGGESKARYAISPSGFVRCEIRDPPAGKSPRNKRLEVGLEEARPLWKRIDGQFVRRRLVLVRGHPPFPELIGGRCGQDRVRDSDGLGDQRPPVLCLGVTARGHRLRELSYSPPRAEPGAICRLT